MRLTQAQRTHIIAAIEPFLKDNPAELFLYGSRARDDLKGGDIDLLLLTEKEHSEDLKKQKTRLLVALKKRLGERRIDFTIAVRDKAQRDPFLASILPQAISLKKWIRTPKQSNNK